MTNDVLVSIIVPVYNVVLFIERCFNSVIGQTYKHLECLFIDDCSPDNSIKILEHLISEYKGSIFFKIIRHEKNRGLSAARNTGTRKAQGDYVYYLDSDDEITPDCIEKLYALAQKYPKVEMVIGNMSVPIHPNSPETDKRKGRDFSHFPEFSDDCDWIVRNMFDSTHGYFIPSTSFNKLAKKSFFDANNIHFMEGIIHEDEKFTYDYAECARAISFCQDVTYIRYWNESSIMTTLTSLTSIRAWQTILLTSFPCAKEPYLKLKLSAGLTEYVGKYLSLPKKVSILQIVLAKRVFLQAWFIARKNGMTKIQKACAIIILLPFRLARLSKNKTKLQRFFDLRNLIS